MSMMLALSRHGERFRAQDHGNPRPRRPRQTTNMILWTGWEILVVVFILVGQAAAYLLAAHLSGDPDYIDLHGWPLGVGYFVSAALCWLLDRRVTGSLDRAWRDPGTGRPIQGKPRAFALHPIRWCGGAMVVIGVLLCFYHRTPEQLWQSRQATAARMEARRGHHEPPPTAVP